MFRFTKDQLDFSDMLKFPELKNMSQVFDLSSLSDLVDNINDFSSEDFGITENDITQALNELNSVSNYKNIY